MKNVIDYFKVLFTFIPFLFQYSRMKAMLFYSATFSVVRPLSRNRFIVRKRKWLANMEAAQKYDMMKHARVVSSKVTYSPLTEEQKRPTIVPTIKPMETIESDLEMARR